MALSCLQGVELALFAAAFLCGAVAAVTLTLTQASFNGSCPLYGVAVLKGSSLALSCPSAPSVCHFVAWVSGLLALYSLLRPLFWIFSSWMGTFHRSAVVSYIALGISATASFLLLVSAWHMCLDVSFLTTLWPHGCSEAQEISWTFPGTTLQFYTNLHTAETSSWVILVLWCLMLILQVIQSKSGDTSYTYTSDTSYGSLERDGHQWISETDALLGYE